MQTQWWYSNDGQKLGPVALEALQQKILAQQVPLTSLVWREGFNNWQPLADVDEFKHVVKALPPDLPPTLPPALPPTLPAALPTASPPAQPQTSSAQPAKPWKRLAAKVIDLSVFGLIVGLSYGFIIGKFANMGYPFGMWLLEPGAEVLLGLVLVPFILLLEACCHACFGNTPGKLLLGLKVHSILSNKPTLPQLLKRQLGVYWYGLGLGLPLISLITMSFQYGRLKQTGSTRYDANQFTVTEQKISIVRMVLIAVLVVLMLLTAIVLQGMARRSHSSPAEQTRQTTPSKPAESSPIAAQPPSDPQQTSSQLSGYVIMDDPVLGKASLARDKKTGLVWQRCSVGQSWSGSTCTGEAKTFTFNQAQQLAGGGWRVPTARELHSIVVCSSGQTQHVDDPKDGGAAIKHWCGGNYIRPTINTAIFPETPEYLYWTSSPYVGNSSNAWVVIFGNGYVLNVNRNYDLHVRLVRASQ